MSGLLFDPVATIRIPQATLADGATSTLWTVVRDGTVVQAVSLQISVAGAIAATVYYTLQALDPTGLLLWQSSDCQPVTTNTPLSLAFSNLGAANAISLSASPNQVYGYDPIPTMALARSSSLTFLLSGATSGWTITTGAVAVNESGSTAAADDGSQLALAAPTWVAIPIELAAA